MDNLPRHLPAEVRARIIERRRARAKELGNPDPYPGEPTPDEETD